MDDGVIGGGKSPIDGGGRCDGCIGGSKNDGLIGGGRLDGAIGGRSLWSDGVIGG